MTSPCPPAAASCRGVLALDLRQFGSTPCFSRYATICVCPAAAARCCSPSEQHVRHRQQRSKSSTGALPRGQPARWGVRVTMCFTHQRLAFIGVCTFEERRHARLAPAAASRITLQRGGSRHHLLQLSKITCTSSAQHALGQLRRLALLGHTGGLQQLPARLTAWPSVNRQPCDQQHTTASVSYEPA